MTKLEQLIQELCPDGVEYKRLGDIAQIGTGSSNGNESEENGKYPFFVRSQFVKAKNAYEYDEEAIIIPGEGGIGDIFHYVNGKYALHQRVYRIHFTADIVNTRFAYYYMAAFFKQFILRKAVNATVSSIRKPMIEDFAVPLPPLPVQQEIVRILDSFTGLTAELTAELTARRKQYEYYRDELLTFGDNVPMATLGDVAVVTKLAGFEFTKYVRYSDSGNIIALRGLNVKNGKLDLTDVKYIDNSDFSKLTRSKLHVGDMLFTYVGTIGQVALIDEEDKYYLAPNVALIRSIDDRLSPQYMRYYFQSSNFWKTQINKLLQASSMQNIPMEKIRKFAIPLPSLEEQRRIISSLDRFDALCNDLTSGLPAEIEARQKQYEYYRDKLLKFKSLSRNS